MQWCILFYMIHKTIPSYMHGLLKPETKNFSRWTTIYTKFKQKVDLHQGSQLKCKQAPAHCGRGRFTNWAGSGDPLGVILTGEELELASRSAGIVVGLDAALCVVSCSNMAKTSDIGGRILASLVHCNARRPTIKAPLWEYWPSNLVSIIRNTLRLSLR